MRGSLLRAAALGWLGVLAACKQQRADPEPQNPAATSGGRFVQRALAELSVLHDSVTPSDWLRAHPADSFVIYTPGQVTEGQRTWCGRASVRDSLPGTGPFLRRAYFFPPTLPPSLDLPTSAGAQDLVQRQCLLGAIWVESPVADSADGRRQAEALRAALSPLHGPVTPGPDAFFGRQLSDSQKRGLARLAAFESLQLGVSFLGAAGWRTLGRWQVDSMTVVSAFDAGLGPTDPRRVLALAYFARSHFEKSMSELTAEAQASMERHRAPDTTVAAVARRTGIDDRTTAAVLALQGREAPDAVRLAALRTWLAAARALDSAHRAAALFVADAVAPGGFDIKDSLSRIPFQRLGFDFVYSELGGGYNYTHTLLEQALQLDPGGAIGELVRLVKVRSGFNLNGMCGGGGEAFRRVIAEGGALLSGAKDPELQAELQFLIGDAYADIAALAAGEGNEYADTAAYAAESPKARLDAIAQYRAGLAIDHRSAKARSAWLEAWRLLAGLPPTTTHFFCVYD